MHRENPHNGGSSTSPVQRPAGGMPAGIPMKGCRPLTDAEVIAVAGELARTLHGTRDVALFLTGVRTGFRVSELLSLRVGAAFQNGNYVDFLTVQKMYMKGKAVSRGVPLHTEARAALERQVGELTARGKAGARDYLFPSRQGGSRAICRTQAWRVLKASFKALGLTGTLSTHVMRKTFARRMWEYFGHDLVLLQQALGHARITSTVSYISFAEKQVSDAFLKS